MYSVVTTFGVLVDLSVMRSVGPTKGELRINGIAALSLSAKDCFALRDALDTYGEMILAAEREREGKDTSRFSGSVLVPPPPVVKKKGDEE